MRHRAHSLLIVSILAQILSPEYASAQSDSSHAVVRDVILRGNSVTNDEVIIREMTMRRGSPISKEAIELDRQRIFNLQIFNRVQILAGPESDSADIHVIVDERWYFYPIPVIGVRDHDFKKLYYGLGVIHQNVAGLNQKLFVQAVTGYDRWVQASFSNPRFLGSQDYFFGLSASYSSLRPNDADGSEYRQTLVNSSVSFGKRFGYNQILVSSLGVQSWEAPAGSSLRTASSSGKDIFLTASVTYVDDRQYLREYPMQGSYFSARLTKDGFGESELNLLTASLDYRSYLPVFWDWSVGVRGYASAVTGGVVPSYRKIYYGFDERIRGSFLTSREGEGRLGGNAELRIPILLPRYLEIPRIPLPQFRVLRYGMYAGLFVDAGKIWYRSQSPWSVATESGYGVGLHFILPYGLTGRLDFALDRWGNAEIVVDGGASF